jgi:hypothetical protein
LRLSTETISTNIPLRAGIAREHFVLAGENFSDFNDWAPRAPLRCSLTFTKEGLILGRGTVLARPAGGAFSRLASEGGEERILALLSAAINKTVPARVTGYLHRASEH